MRASQGKFIILLISLIGLSAILYAIAASKTTDSDWIKWMSLRGAMVLSIVSILFLFILIILPINDKISFERALSFLAPVQDQASQYHCKLKI
jgi:multisubunit Na+/H+ antiporter MnhB subunit